MARKNTRKIVFLLLGLLFPVVGGIISRYRGGLHEEDFGLFLISLVGLLCCWIKAFGLKEIMCTLLGGFFAFSVIFMNIAKEQLGSPTDRPTAQSAHARHGGPPWVRLVTFALDEWKNHEADENRRKAEEYRRAREHLDSLRRIEPGEINTNQTLTAVNNLTSPYDFHFLTRDNSETVGINSKTNNIVKANAQLNVVPSHTIDEKADDDQN